MLFRLAADAVLVLHAAFVLFVAFGGLAALRWRRLPWVHLPALVWGVLVELAGWTCPLTDLESALRRRAGLAGYSGGFIEHYVVEVLYPPGLTRSFQIFLGIALLVCNLLVYGWLVRRRRRERVP